MEYVQLIVLSKYQCVSLLKFNMDDDEPVTKIRRSSQVSFKALALAAWEKTDKRVSVSDQFAMPRQLQCDMITKYNLHQIRNLSTE